MRKGENRREIEYELLGSGSVWFDRERPSGDALISDEPGILLEIRAADCAPVLIADLRHRAVAAVHAGWRGALERIIEKSVGEMQRTFGSSPRDLLVAIGPSIRACCYEVGEEVIEAFQSCFVCGEKFFGESPGENPDGEVARRYPLDFLRSAPPGCRPAATAYLNLVAVVRDQLALAGVDSSKVYTAEFCTACRTDLFFSYRKEGRSAGRMAAVIGIRPGRTGRRTSARIHRGGYS